MQDNDRTIFSYLNPISNDMLSKLDKKDLDEMLLCLDRYYLEYRDLLGFDINNTFGIEIEIERFKGGVDEFEMFQQLINKIVGNNNWKTKNDITLINGKSFGREIASDILIDRRKTWLNIKNVCNFVSKWGVIGDKCGGHVHVGAHLLGNNPLYWYRFLKLCSVYENVIYRFGYGEYLTHRPIIQYKAKPVALLYASRLSIMESKLNGSLFEFLTSVDIKHIGTDSLKDYGISFWHMICDDNYELYDDYNKFNEHCTLEYRCPNGTLDYVIWQNNINFIVNLMLYCKSEKFDEDILNRRKIEVEGIFGDLWAYSKIYLEQAIELCDMIFDNNLDKLYFLRQYIKSFQVSDKAFVKARKITDTNGSVLGM